MNRFLLLVCFLSAACYSTELEDSVQIANCQYWKYVPSSHGYVCASTAGLVYVPTVRDLDELARVVSNQAQTIADLEARVRKLETP